MADRTVITSTTDTPEDVKAALTAGAASEVEGEEAETEGAEAEGESAEAETEEELAKPAAGARKPVADTVEGLQKKLKRMTFEQHRVMDVAEQQRALNQSLLERIKALEAGGTKTKAEPEEPEIPAFPDPEPSLEDAETIEKWAKDHGEWVRKKTIHEIEHRQEAKGKKAAATTAEEKARETQQRIQTEHDVRVNKFAETHEDFFDIAQAAIDAGVQINNAALSHIMQSENGPAILYYLGTHHDEANKLFKMPFGPTLVRLGRIETLLEKEAGTATDDGAGDEGEGDEAQPVRGRPLVAASGQPNKTKVVPKPPSRIAAGTGGKSTKDPSKMTAKEYRDWREKGGGRQ